jgi:mRNA-degrading endonuclease RelE of RelBE toxin-antitoxin system
MAAYAIDVRPRARRSLQQLDPSVRKAIAQVIEGLTGPVAPQRAAPRSVQRSPDGQGK